MKRTYKLVYIIRPDATEQQVADLHTQVEQIVGRMGGTTREDRGAAGVRRPAQARLRNRPSQGRHLRPRSDQGQRRARARARSPAEGHRRSAAPPDRPRRRGSDQGRARAHQATGRIAPPPRSPADLPPDRQPGEGPQNDDSDDAGDYDGVEAEA